MCANFKATSDYKVLKEAFGFSQHRFSVSDFSDSQLYPGYGKAPIIYVDNGRITLGSFSWGILGKDGAPIMGFETHNAQSEEVEKKKLYGPLWTNRQRCIIPVAEFYEYRQERDVKRRVAIAPEGKSLFCIAGLWDRSNGPDDLAKWSFTMMTTKPSEQMARVHHRMPVIIDRWKAFLDPRTTPEQAKTLCVPYPGPLRMDYADRL